MPRSHLSDRCGFTVVETIITGVLVGAIIIIALPTLHWIGLEQRHTSHRQLAMFEASNLLEQLSAKKWDELSPELAAAMRLSDEAAQQLPEAELQVTIEPGKEPPEAKHLRVALFWKNRDKVARSSVQLSAWVYHAREGN